MSKYRYNVITALSWNKISFLTAELDLVKYGSNIVNSTCSQISTVVQIPRICEKCWILKVPELSKEMLTTIVHVSSYLPLPGEILYIVIRAMIQGRKEGIHEGSGLGYARFQWTSFLWLPSFMPSILLSLFVYADTEAKKGIRNGMEMRNAKMRMNGGEEKQFSSFK